MASNQNTKHITFIAIMAALGNVLSFLTMQLSPIAPSIPLGPVSVSIALDISHLTTFLAAIFGGPIVGAITGAVGGLVAAFQFGFSQGNIVTGIGLPVGKALTGLTAGYVFKRFSGSRTLTVMAAVVSYIPESILAYLLFKYLLPVTVGIPVEIAVAISIQIIVKAIIEMLILGLIISQLDGYPAFRTIIDGYFGKEQ